MKAKNLIFWLIVLSVFIATASWAAALNPLGGFGPRKAMPAGIAVADDLAAFYYNPALLLKAGNFAQAGLEGMRANFVYKNAAGREYNAKTGNYLTPSIGVNYRINDKLAAGLGIYTPYGFGADFKDELGLYSKMSLTNLAPAVAYKVSDKLTLGLSTKAGLGQIEQSQPTASGRLDSRSDGYGYSAQVGLLWEAADWLRFGLTYQTKTKVMLDGNAKYVDTGASDTYTGEFYFPGYYGFGVGMEFGNLLIAADVMRFDYSSTDTALTNYRHWPQGVQALHWENNTFWGVGAEYKFRNVWRLRGGLVYQDAVIPDSTINASGPDMNGYSAGLGLGYRGQNINMDINYIHIWGPERTVQGTYFGAGRYSADINIISTAISWRW
ncbi:MAG: outer membrane protein transport protein [Candidatus Portnoybacteria bacterium]|nr:outer membrane protein transport protein [Candidatus Portnoybacteria bacterium]MDD4982364.1 outer membrane protein transport protein [Candidatus Portnoybacteria bacterium]